MKNNQSGKGDKRRPFSKKEYDKNYDEIFRKSLTKPKDSDKIDK